MAGLAPLRHRSFRLLVGGQLASNAGDACYAVALPWYVLAAHGGLWLLATVLAAYGVPRTVFVALGGHASDRWHPWTTMMGADALRAVTVSTLGVAALSWRPSAVILVPIAALTGAGEGVFLPGSFSIVPLLLPDGDLQAGNAIASASTQFASLVGPGLGGALVAAVGPAGAFFVDAASFVLSAISLMGVRAEMHTPLVGPPDRSRPIGEAGVAIADGGPAATGPRRSAPTLRELLRSERVLRVIFFVSVAANLGLGGMGAVALPALAHGPLHTGAAGYGGLVAALGGGALVGTLAAGHVRRLSRPAVIASAALVADAAVMAVVPYLGGLLLVAGGLVVVGGLIGFGNVLTVTAFQRWAPPSMLGRLMGLLLLASFGVFPLSVVLAGAVVGTLGPAAFFVVAAGVLAVSVLAGLMQPSGRQFGSPGSAAVWGPPSGSDGREPAISKQVR